MSNFDDMIDRTGLSPAEEARLRRTHDLLIAAGPPPDLPPRLEHPPSKATEAEILQFPLLPKRRWAAAAVAAAALVLATFFGGYLLGHDRAHRRGFQAIRSVELRGNGTAFASLQLGGADSVGNWPMVLSVTGLPEQKARSAYYELYLTRNGRPTVPCGSFRVHGSSSTTSVRFSVPYTRRQGDGWVVTVQQPGVHEPGRVLLST
jgi:hypothetical protein